MISEQISRAKIRLGDWYRWNFEWRNIPQAILVDEIPTGDWGGCQLFIHDINNDGKPEFLWLQSCGIFKSKLYLNGNNARSEYLSQYGQDHFCLTATSPSGELFWQIGKPYSGSAPYLSHATERMITCCDLDGDGKIEVITFNGSDELLVLDGISGSIKDSMRLPADNFAIVKFGRTGTGAGDLHLLVGVMADAYPPYSYANPWLFFDPQLDLVHEGEYIGSGHQIIPFDPDQDGQDEFLIGYQFVDTDGQVIWTLDDWSEKSILPIEQHVDHAEIYWSDRKWFAALSGSDEQYWIDSSGKTIWKRKLPHPQYCILGHEAGELRIFVINQREGMSCFDAKGEEIWQGIIPENWPKGRPRNAFHPRPIHVTIPADKVTLIQGDSSAKELILYKEGGWPYVINFRGQPVYRFTPGDLCKIQSLDTPITRINNLGLSYEAEVYDVNGDGRQEVIIYNREFASIYSF